MSSDEESSQNNDYFEKRNQAKVERKLVERLEHLGYKVTLQPKTLAS